jgi:hypothetical protein
MKLITLIFIICAALTACGGGGDDTIDTTAIDPCGSEFVGPRQPGECFVGPVRPPAPVASAPVA